MFSGSTNLLGRAVSGLPTCARPRRSLLQGLLGDIAALKPTMFVGVPRVFDRIYTSVMGKTKAAVRLAHRPPASLISLSQASDSSLVCTSPEVLFRVQDLRCAPLRLLNRACNSSKVYHCTERAAIAVSTTGGDALQGWLPCSSSRVTTGEAHSRAGCRAAEVSQRRSDAGRHQGLPIQPRLQAEAALHRGGPLAGHGDLLPDTPPCPAAPWAEEVGQTTDALEGCHHGTSLSQGRQEPAKSRREHGEQSVYKCQPDVVRQGREE